MTGTEATILLAMLDKAITAIFAALRAINAEEEEVKAKKAELIAKIKALPDLPVEEDV